MADFSALKTSIQNYIKQNGNEEITGNLLQQILLSMVTTLGDSAINDLVTALNNEVTARGNADGTLQTNINNEATTRGNADTQLGNRITSEAEAREGADNTLHGLIDGIKDDIENGYVYAGIATPSTTPARGKVFYLALTAGTYTNFGATVVPQGINILKYNGAAWSLDTFIGLDDAPTQGSNKLVKSGGVADVIGVGKNFGSSTPVTVPFEFEVGKSYYIRDNRPVSASYTPIYVRETENGANVLVTNLGAGKTYKFTPEIAYHYVRVVPTATPAGASDFTIYEANSVNGRIKTVEDNNNDITTKLNALRNGSEFNVSASCIEFEQGSLSTNEGGKINSNYRIRTAGYLFVRQTTSILLPADISSVGIYYYNANDKSFDHYTNTGTGVGFAYIPASEYLIKFVLKKTDDTEIAPKDVTIFTSDTTDIIIEQLNRNTQNITDLTNRVTIDEIAFEQGSIGTTDGKDVISAKRIRSKNYLYGGYKVTLPSGFKIYTVSYYDVTDGSYVGYKQPLVDLYVILGTLVKDDVEHTVKARIVVSKTTDTDDIIVEDIKKSFALEELYDKSKVLDNITTALENRVTADETKLSETADIVKNIQTCETAGTVVANVACTMLAGHKYIITNTSDEYTYFAVYARETATSSNITISLSLAWKTSVMFTPEVNCQYIRLSASAVAGKSCKVSVEDTGTHEYRIAQLEKWKPTVDNHLSQIDAKLNISKHIFIGDIPYNLNTCSGWVRGNVPAPLYAEQLYDALVSAYPSYVTKIDCKTDSGIEVPSYYSNTIMDGGQYLTLPFPMYHFKPLSYNDASLVKVFLTGGVHGEAIGVNSLYHFCKVLCEEATDDIKNLKYGIDLYVMPYCNPSTPYIQQREYEWEGQTMHPISSGRLNWNLVNINRNMPTSGWTLTQQYTDTGQPYQDYSGPTAGSEYESQVIMHYANLIQPDIMMDCHNSDIIGDNTPEQDSMVWILRNVTNSDISRVTARVSYDCMPRISKTIQASDRNFPTDFLLTLAYLDSEPVGRGTVINWFSEIFNIPTYTSEGAQRFPYDNGVLIPTTQRVSDVTDPRFTKYQELAIESIIKRTIQELYG